MANSKKKELMRNQSPPRTFIKPRNDEFFEFRVLNNENNVINKRVLEANENLVFGQSL